jgi:hypothetical protein
MAHCPYERGTLGRGQVTAKSFYTRKIPPFDRILKFYKWPRMNGMPDSSENYAIFTKDTKF